MEIFVGVIVVIAIIGAVLWNHHNAARAFDGVTFVFGHPPSVVGTAIDRVHNQGAKAAIRRTIGGLTVTSLGPTGFATASKMGDSGEISITRTPEGCTVTARALSLHVGMPPRYLNTTSTGIWALSVAMSDAIYRTLRIAPGAAAFKRWQRGLEGRLAAALPGSTVSGLQASQRPVGRGQVGAKAAGQRPVEDAPDELAGSADRPGGTRSASALPTRSAPAPSAMPADPTVGSGRMPSPQPVRPASPGPSISGSTVGGTSKLSLPPLLPSGLPPVPAGSAPSLTPPGSPVGAPPAGARRRKWLPPVAVGAVLVIAAGVAGGYWLTRPGEALTLTAAPPTLVQASPVTNESTPAEPDNKAAAPPATAAATPSPASYRCWNGKTAHELSDCSDPASATTDEASTDALNWVFEDRAGRLKAADATCRDNSDLRARYLHRKCQLTFRGSKVCMNYSQWVDADTALNYYNNNIGAAAARERRNGNTQLVWGPARTTNHCGGLDYKTATMVRDGQWGLTVYSDSPATASQAVRHFGVFRPFSEWRGTRQ